MAWRRIDLERFRRCWAPDVVLVAGLLMSAVWLVSQQDSSNQSNRVQDRLEGHSSAVTSLAFTSDGTDLVSASWDGTVRVWDVVAKTEKRVATRNSTAFFSIAHSRDGRFFAIGGDDGRLSIWDTSGPRPLHVLASGSRVVRALALSPDRKTLASKDRKAVGSPGWYTTVRLWDIASGRPLVDLLGHSDVVTGAVFTPEGRTLVTSSLDGTIRLWDVASGRGTGELVVRSSDAAEAALGRPRAIVGLAMTPDGKTLAAGGYDYCAIRLWNLADGSELPSLRGHTVGVRSLSFSPDGRYLASAGGDHTVRLWDWRSGQVVASSPGHAGWVKALAYSPDGARIAAGGDDGSIRIWDVGGVRSAVAAAR